MKLPSPLIVLLLGLLALAPPVAAQERFEFGGLALLAAYRGTEVRSGPTVGSVGFQPGPSGGVFLGQTLNHRLGGELRYLFARNTQKLSSGGAEATFTGRSHIVGYDLLVYLQSPETRWRPFVAGGGGLKVYQGTGTEQAFQPLWPLALLTRTREAMPMVDFGAGLKYRLSHNTMIRVEFRDYVTEVPKVFEPSPGAKISGILHHWAPAFGFSWTF